MWCLYRNKVSLLPRQSLTPCLAVRSTYICKQVVPRSGPTECQARSGSKLFETRIVFLKEFFEKVKFEKRSAEDPEVKKNMKISQHAKSFEWFCIDCYRKLLMIIFKGDIFKG